MRACYSLIGIAHSWKCDAKCAHCFIPDSCRYDEIDDNLLNILVNELPDSIKVVSLSGGEPFFDTRRLEKIITTALHNDKRTVAVTNAIWTTRIDPARYIPYLYKLGLRGLSISMDSYHVPQDRIRNIARLVETLRELDMAIEFRIFSKEEVDIINSVLGLVKKGDVAYDVRKSDLIPIGRAELLASASKRRKAVRGGCANIFEPMVTPGGDVYACHTVRVNEIRNNVLRLGNIREHNIKEILGRGFENSLHYMLLARGPESMAEMVDREDLLHYDRCKMCLEITNDYKLTKTAIEKIKEIPGYERQLFAESIIAVARNRQGLSENVLK